MNRYVLGLLAASSLAGCSSLGSVKTAAPATHFPADYEVRVSTSLLNRGEIGNVTVPREIKGWSIREPDAWLVCLRRADGSMTSVFLGELGIAGQIKGDTPYCSGQLTMHPVHW